MKFALVNQDGTIVTFNDDINPDKIPVTPDWPKWLPVVVDDPAFDPVTQIRSGPVLVIGATEVTERFTVRSKTLDERSAAIDERVNQLNKDVLKLIENHETRLLAIEQKPSGGFLSWVRSLFS